MSCDHLKAIVAPMINQSDAPFRSLCLKYGATCAYTEMLYSDRIINESDYLLSMIPSQDHLIGISRPLIVQICGNNPDILSKAVDKILHHGFVDGIDFNLGCPQDKAKNDLFGSYLLDKCHWDRVFQCVKSMIDTINNKIPFSCKIRICDGENKLMNTISFCEGLYDSGVNIICIHGRTRGSTRHRRAGAADLDIIKKIAIKFINKINIICNGNVITPYDVSNNLLQTNPCIGIMSAEGILADPAIFARAFNNDNKIPDRQTLFEEYCLLSNKYLDLGGWELKHAYISDNSSDTNASTRQLSVAKQHLSYMLGKSGHGRTIRYVHSGNYKKHYELMKDINESNSILDLIKVSKNCLSNVHGSQSINFE